MFHVTILSVLARLEDASSDGAGPWSSWIVLVVSGDFAIYLESFSFFREALEARLILVRSCFRLLLEQGAKPARDINSRNCLRSIFCRIFRRP